MSTCSDRVEFLRRFDEQCRQRSDHVALINDANDQSVTFAELRRDAVEISKLLTWTRHDVLHSRDAALPIVPTKFVVGLFIQDPVKTTASLLACWMSGCVPLPIPTQSSCPYPVDWTSDTIERFQCCHIVLHDSEPAISYRELAFFNISHQVPQAFAHSSCQICESTVQDRVMHCLFTSGSTGPPRGVFGTFAGFLNRIDWANSHSILAFAETDVGCCVTSSTFVDYFAQVFEALLAGCPVVLFARNVILSGQLLLERMVHHKITRLTAVPSLLKGLIRFAMSAPDLFVAGLQLRCVISSGEALFRRTAIQLLQLFPCIELFNVYGTTEVAADCACFHVERHSVPDSEIVPIGFALPGFQLLLKKIQESDVSQDDEALNEICVSGIGLCDGTTTESDAQFGVDELHGKYFRTGDIGRSSSHGCFEYVGRRSRIVKVRGARVNLMAVQAQLLAMPGVVDGAALELTLNEQSGPELVAFVCMPADIAFPGDSFLSLLPQQSWEVLNFHFKTLDPVCTPTACFVYRSANSLPLNAHGKIDMFQLQQPVTDYLAKTSARIPLQSQSESVARSISEVIKIVLTGLQNTAIQSTDNFVSLGGDSVLAIQAAHLLSARFNVEISPHLLLTQADFGQFTAVVESLLNQRSAGQVSGELRIPNGSYTAAVAPNIVHDEFLSEDSLVVSRASRYRICSSAVKRRTSGASMSRSRNDFQLPRCISPPPPSEAVRLPSGSLPRQKLLLDSMRRNSVDVQFIEMIKCVDASPVLVHGSDGTRCVVGSHAGLLTCVDISDRISEVWSVALPHRIEGAATYSAETSVIFVGCHDGKLYAIDAATGFILDVFAPLPDQLESWYQCDSKYANESSNPIKTTPLVFGAFDQQFVAFGDYSGRFHIVQVAIGVNTLKRKLDQPVVDHAVSARIFINAMQFRLNASVFAEAVWSDSLKSLFCSSIKGDAFCVTCASASNRLPDFRIKWSAALAAPVFASPIVLLDAVVIYSTIEGFMIELDVADGKIIRSLNLKSGPLFATPVLFASDDMMVVPSHLGKMLAVDLQRLSVLWTVSTSDGHKLPTSLARQLTLTANGPTFTDLVCFCSSNGCLHIARISRSSCNVLSCVELEAQCFSSPVWLQDCIVLGARDDRLHCFRT